MCTESYPGSLGFLTSLKIRSENVLDKLRVVGSVVDLGSLKDFQAPGEASNPLSSVVDPE